MKKKFFLIPFAALIALAFMSAWIYAGTSCPGTIEMNSKIFKKHRMGIVKFEHEKHLAAPPKGYGLKCGECHHDKNHKPLDNLKPTDKIKHCEECHKTPGKASPRAFMKPSKKDLKKYYVAIHANCIGCHKKMKKGPTSCVKCHPKKSKK